MVIAHDISYGCLLAHMFIEILPAAFVVWGEYCEISQLWTLELVRILRSSMAPLTTLV